MFDKKKLYFTKIENSIYLAEALSANVMVNKVHFPIIYYIRKIFCFTKLKESTYVTQKCGTHMLKQVRFYYYYIVQSDIPFYVTLAFLYKEFTKQ